MTQNTYVFDSYLPSSNPCLWLRDSTKQSSFATARFDWSDWKRKPEFGEELTTVRNEKHELVQVLSGKEVIYEKP